mgnify:CR=1 FL=1
MFEKANDINRDTADGIEKYAFELYNAGRKLYAWQVAQKHGPLGEPVDDRLQSSGGNAGRIIAAQTTDNGGWVSPPAEENPYHTSACHVSDLNGEPLVKES